MSDTGMRQLSREEADLLNSCRDLLSGLAKSAQGLSWVGEGAYKRGIIYESCDRAHAALVEALSSLACYGDDPEARAGIERYWEPKTETVAGGTGS